MSKELTTEGKRLTKKLIDKVRGRVIDNVKRWDDKDGDGLIMASVKNTTSLFFKPKNKLKCIECG